LGSGLTFAKILALVVETKKRDSKDVNNPCLLLTHNTDVHDPSELTLITSKKDMAWAQPIFVLQRLGSVGILIYTLFAC
jgi:hypothetical protein